jgi:hypothetical protein
MLEDKRKQDLKKLRESLTERQEKLDELFVEKKLVDQHELKDKSTRFNCLPKELKLAIESLKFTHNLPEEMSVQALLATVNFATSCHYNLDPEFFGKGIRVTTNGFFMTLAPTGGTKSTIFKTVSTGVERFEEEERIRFQTEYEAYQLQKAIYDKQHKKILNSKDAVNDVNWVQDQLNDLGEQPEEPIGSTYTVKTATRNGLIDVLSQVPFARISSDEGGEFFSGHAMGNKVESNAQEMITTLSDLWSGGKIDRNTGMDRTTIANRRFTMFFMLQHEMAKFINLPIYSQQGFMHRFLITHTDYWEMPDLDVTRLPQIKKEQEKLEPFHQRIYELLKQQKHFKEGTLKELDLPTYKVDEDALDLVSKYSNELKKESRPNGTYEQWQGFTLRTLEHVLILSANLACFEGKKSIDINSVSAGIELFEFYLQQRVTLDVGVESKFAEVIQNAERFLQWFEKKKETVEGVKKGFITQNAPRWYSKQLTRTERDRVLEELIDQGRIKVELMDNNSIFRRKSV